MNTVPTDLNAQDAQPPSYTNDFSTIPSVTFATHNVRSFTNPAKQQSLIELYTSLNCDVIGLQETNFIKNHIKPFNIRFNNRFSGFFGTQPSSDKQLSGFGVSLLLTPHLSN